MLFSPLQRFGSCHCCCGIKSGYRRCLEARRVTLAALPFVGSAPSDAKRDALRGSACAIRVETVVPGICRDGAPRSSAKSLMTLAETTSADSGTCRLARASAPSTCHVAHAYDKCRTASRVETISLAQVYSTACPMAAARQPPRPHHAHTLFAVAVWGGTRELHEIRERCHIQPNKLINDILTRLHSMALACMWTTWLLAQRLCLDAPSSGFTIAGGCCSLPHPSSGFSVAGMVGAAQSYIHSLSFA